MRANVAKENSEDNLSGQYVVTTLGLISANSGTGKQQKRRHLGGCCWWCVVQLYAKVCVRCLRVLCVESAQSWAFGVCGCIVQFKRLLPGHLEKISYFWARQVY